MKFFKWRIFIITSIACLLPILLGLALWEKLPETIAIHFDFYGNPDSFASKPFAVFGLPLLMVVLQAFCCIFLLIPYAVISVIYGIKTAKKQA